MKSRLLAGMLGATVVAVGCAKVVVVRVPADSKDNGLKAEGVFYALPKTVARVLLEIDRDVKTDAPYSHFAAIFAPDGAVACGEKTGCAKPKDDKGQIQADEPATKISYSIQKGATFSTYGEPDPAEIYMVKFVGNGEIDQSLSMTWNEAGLLSAATSTTTNRTIDLVTSGVKLAAGLGSKAMYGAATVAPAAPSPCPVPSTDAPTDVRVAAILTQAGTAAKTLLANYCDISKANRDKLFTAGHTLEELERATGAFTVRVVTLADARARLLGGLGNALDPIPLINKIETLIDQQLKALYLGSSATTTWETALDVRALDPKTPVELVKIDPMAAAICVDTAMLSPDAKPIPKGFDVRGKAEDCAKLKPTVIASLALEYYPAQNSQLFERVKNKTSDPSGELSFRYRLPAQVKAALRDDKDTYGIGVFSVAQLGHVVALPAERHSKSLTYELAMIEATGALKTFKLGTTGGLDAATIDAMSAAGGGVIDARNAARKKAQEADDEVTLLTRESTLLKLKDSICDVQKKYGVECTFKPE